MLDIVRTPVARTIELELRDERLPIDIYRRDDRGPIAEEPPPTGRIPTAGFVSQLFRGKTIEHLARLDMVGLDRFGRPPGPSSLFFQTVHAAYAGHHALGLRPDVLMYLIASVVAETVRRHPQAYRDLFTT